MSKSALILLTTMWPHSGGGGAGITYRMLEGFSRNFPDLGNCDVYGLFGKCLLPFTSSADAGRVLAEPRRLWPSKVPKFVMRSTKWLSQSQTVSRLARQYDSTVVLAHEYFYARRFAPRKGLFVIQAEHSKGGLHTEYLALTGNKDFQYHCSRRLVNEAMLQADRVVFPSKGAADLYEASNPGTDLHGKTAIIYNGVDDPLKNGTVSPGSRQNAGLLTVVNVANHVPEKGIDVALEGVILWKARSAASRSIRFVNCGQTGGESGRLQELAARGGLGADCHFRGFMRKDQVLEAMANADVFALTPRVAVFDLALLEAMALAKPIISTPVGGNLEALGERYGHYARTPEEFAHQLDRLVEQKERASATGEQNRQRFLERFTSQTMMDSYLSLVAAGLDGAAERKAAA